MNSTRTPFKVMRSTVAVLQASVLPILATLKAESLDGESLKLVTTIVFAREHTAIQLKSNPSRSKMLVLCLAWYRLANSLLPVIEDQPVLVDGLRTILETDAVKWVKEVNPNMRMAEAVNL